MPSDKTRTSDDIRQGYKGPVMQEGRVILDRDFNALQETLSGAIEADVCDGGPFEEARVERLAIGALMHETAGLRSGKERRASGGHYGTRRIDVSGVMGRVL